MLDLAGEHDPPTRWCARLLWVFHSASPDAPQIPVLDSRVVGDQQGERRVLEFKSEVQVAVGDLRGAQVENGLPAVGTHEELKLRGPVPQPFGHLMVRANPDRVGGRGWCSSKRPSS